MEKRFYDEYLVGLTQGRLKRGWIFQGFWWIGVALASSIIWLMAIDTNNDGGEIGILTFLFLLFFISAMIFANSYTYKESHVIHPQFKSVDTMMSFLPINKDEIPRKASANRVVNGIPMFIFMSIVILIGNSRGEIVGVRGIIVTISILILVIFTMEHINLYTQRFWKKKVKEKVEFQEKKKESFIGGVIRIMIWCACFDAMTSTGIFDGFSINFHSAITTFLPFQILGNKIVGIVLLVVSIIGFYYFNYTYILKGVKEEGWKLWRD
ncbi:MAG: hypothetical protein ACRC2K_10170 [Clostridium sp.]